MRSHATWSSFGNRVFKNNHDSSSPPLVFTQAIEVDQITIIDPDTNKPAPFDISYFLLFPSKYSDTALNGLYISARCRSYSAQITLLYNLLLLPQSSKTNFSVFHQLPKVYTPQISIQHYSHAGPLVPVPGCYCSSF